MCLQTRKHHLRLCRVQCHGGCSYNHQMHQRPTSITPSSAKTPRSSHLTFDSKRLGIQYGLHNSGKKKESYDREIGWRASRD